MQKVWRKSSRSGGTQGQCVETCSYEGAVLVRDSKLGDESPELNTSRTDWAGFLASVKR
ncbi:MAG: DUF397 domain-containing protein [Stackebrandtia sp.]